jgi:hypothetical protein
MTQQHPITPPPELVKQWWKEAQQADYSDGLPCWLNYVATQAARWGAFLRELEACKEWVSWRHSRHESDELLFARRPKPPSLKEQALEEVGVFEGMGTCNIDIIRRALESLPD